jgi:hypothetical protein
MALQNCCCWSYCLFNASHCLSVLQLKPWKLEGGDHTLLDLMPFLDAIYRANPPDVRKIVEGYEGQDIPTAFRYECMICTHSHG